MPNRDGRLISRPYHPQDGSADPYRSLIAAIVARAVLDARGQCNPTHGSNDAQIQADARAWLQDEQAVVALIELGGYDSAGVVRRVRQVLTTTGTPPQFALFGRDTGR